MTVDVMVVGPDVGDGPHIRDIGVSTVPDPRAHHPAAIVIATCRRPVSRPSRSQSRAAKYAWKRSNTWLAAFSSRGAGG